VKAVPKITATMALLSGRHGPGGRPAGLRYRARVNPGGLISDALIGMLPGDGLGIDPGTWLVYLRSYVW